MTKSLSQPDNHHAHKRTVLTTTALFILLCVIALRPLVWESYDTAASSFGQALSQIEDPSPLRTIIFDLSILLATLLWLIGYTLGKFSSYRKTGLEWGLLLLAIAGAVSCYYASNKRLAINATIDWLCLPVMTIVLVNLLRTHGHRQLLLAVIVASACAQTAQCLEQSLIGNADSWAHYQSTKESFWANQGISMDDPTVTLFEKRIKANEAQGFLPHSNITGSYLVLSAFLALGALLHRWRSGGFHSAPLRSLALLLIVPAIIAAVATTRSLGAVVSALLGLLLLAVLLRWAKWVSVNKIKILYVGWAGFVAATIAFVGHGLYHNTFPHMSLTFRWQYWKASAKLIGDYFLTGVGRENFGRHYLQYKSILSPEEITNPHNLFVQATAEWGILGLAGILVMLVSVTYLIARSRHVQTTKTPSHQKDSLHTLWWLWGIGLTLAVALLRIPMLGTTDPNFIYYTTIVITGSWLLGFTCSAYLSNQSDTGTHTNQYITTAILCGLFAFLLHDMINFAMFIPASATTFFAAMALVIPTSQSNRDATPNVKPYPWLWPLANLAMIVVVCTAALIPSYQTNRCVENLTSYRKQLGPIKDETKPPYRNIPSACYADALDPTPFTELAKLWMFASSNEERPAGNFRKAIDALREAKTRDPFDIRLQRLIANATIEQARNSHSMRTYLSAAQAARDTVALYPVDPDGLIDAANLEAEVGATLNDRDILRGAITHFQSALTLDDARPWWERIRKLSDARRNQVMEEIQRLEKLAATLTEDDE